MATYYVRSGAGGAADGSDWANAFLTLAAAFSGKAAGDVFYVAGDHAETQASAMTLTSPGTLAAPCQIIGVNHAGSVPPVSADLLDTATITTTGASSMTFAGVAFCRGIIFTSGDGATGGSLLQGGDWRFKNCKFRLGATAGTTVIRGGSLTSNFTQWDNCTVKFGATSQSLSCNGGRLKWINTPSAIEAGSSIGTGGLFSGNCLGIIEVEGVDLSAWTGASREIVPAIGGGALFSFVNCKLDGSIPEKVNAQTAQFTRVDMVRCHGSGNYTAERFQYHGKETTETTIVRSGGSSDGTTAFAKKIETFANAKYITPFEALPIELWNDVEDVSRTLTVFGTWGGGAVPLDDEIWIEVEYLANASDPGGGRVSSAKADILATAGNTDASGETWGGGTTEFQMSVAFTPAQKGPVRVIVKAGKASSTFYICGKVELVNT